MAQQNIHCTVANCHYWENGNKCGASEIMVTSDDMGQAAPDSFDAPYASTAPETTVASCMETCCKTFVDRDSTEKSSDDIYKR